MRLRREVHNAIDRLFGQECCDKLCVAYITLHEAELRVTGSTSEVCDVAGICQRVEYHDTRLRAALQQVVDKVCADEPRATRNQKSVHRGISRITSRSATRQCTGFKLSRSMVLCLS